MKLKLMSLLFSLLIISPVMAVDNDIEKLSKELERTNILLNISNNNVALLENSKARKEINEDMNKNKESNIVALSGRHVYVSINGVIKKLSIGDEFNGSKIKSIGADGFVLVNGQKYNAL